LSLLGIFRWTDRELLAAVGYSLGHGLTWLAGVLIAERRYLPIFPILFFLTTDFSNAKLVIAFLQGWTNTYAKKC
jgi:hypothetical protein